MDRIKEVKLHVYPHKEGWAILTENEKKPSYIFKNANDALIAARKISKNLSAELIVHNRFGEIQYKQKYEQRDEAA